MAKKKIAPKKKVVSKKKAPAKKKVVARAKPARGKAKSAKKPSPRKRIAQHETSSGTERSSLGSVILGGGTRPMRRGLGEEAAGQSGDLQGLSRMENSNSESVEELLEEGQAFEAEAISGVENAPDPDEGEIHTHERPEDESSPEDQEEQT
jgi:hypothetical protein